jgi:hypothetical protein
MNAIEHGIETELIQVMEIGDHGSDRLFARRTEPEVRKAGLIQRNELFSPSSQGSYHFSEVTRQLSFPAPGIDIVGEIALTQFREARNKADTWMG